MIKFTANGVERGSLWPSAIEEAEAADHTGHQPAGYRKLGRDIMRVIADNVSKPRGPEDLMCVARDLVTQNPPLKREAQQLFLQGAHRGVQDYAAANGFSVAFNTEGPERFIPRPAGVAEGEVVIR